MCMRFIRNKDVAIPSRRRDAHKGQSGRVLIIGGSPSYVGAVALAGIAALRGGCDWVTIAAPAKAGWAVNCLSPDLVTVKLPGDSFCAAQFPLLRKHINAHTAILLGNGMGVTAGAKSLCKKVLLHCRRAGKPAVVDADALKMVSLSDLGYGILTPHPKELEHLLRNSGISPANIKRVNTASPIEKKASLVHYLLFSSKSSGKGKAKRAKESPSEKEVIILLKGPIDAVISPSSIAYNRTGNPGMAKAGTGDVLAGLCASFIAQGLFPRQAAINACYFAGLAGDILLKKRKGFTYLASDLAEEIGKLLR